MRKNISTNTPGEERVGYSRAVIINGKVYITGTTSVNETGKTIGSTVYEQTKYCIEKIQSVLENENFSLKDIVVIRAFLVSMKGISEFDKAFKEYFYDIKPTCTLVGTNALVKPDLLIEIECIAEKA